MKALPILLAFAAVSSLPWTTRSAEIVPPPAGTNLIRGVVQFTNVDPDILARLGPPGEEGLGSLTVFAYTDPPDSLQATKNLTAADPLSVPYELTVAADDQARAYHLYAYLVMDGDTEEYWTSPVLASDLTSNSPPATVNLEECVALVEIQYQRADGTPVAASGGRANVYQMDPPAGLRARYGTQPPGRTGNYLVVPAGVELLLEVEVDSGSDAYADRVTHRESFLRTFGCDEKPVLILTIPEPEALGQIVGNLNLVGELELPTDGYLELLGRPVMRAAGPLGNKRLADPGAEWPGPDAVRTFALAGLVPSSPSETWSVAGEIQFGLGDRFEYFRTPALGEGTNNPGVIVTAGNSTDVGDSFVMTPSRLTGTITLTGPPELDGRQSGLRGLVRAGDYDPNSDGIPDGVGPVGIGGSYVYARGVDELAVGSSLSTAGGQALASFAGGFDGGSSAFAGDYVVTVGALNDEPGIWKLDGINLAIEHPGTNNAPLVSESIYITEDELWQGPLLPGETVRQDLRYGMAEVCLRLRSPAPFFYPRVVGSLGAFNGIDWEGRPRSYQSYLSLASAPPYAGGGTTMDATISMYLPEGTYRLQPAISVPDADGGVSEVQLPPVDVTVAAREQVCLDECLQIVLTPPFCATNSGFVAFAEAFSCDSTLTNLSLTSRSLDFPGIRLGYSDIRILAPVGTPRATLKTGHALFPEFDYPGHPEYYSNIVWTAEARDTRGRIATRQFIGRYPFATPPLNCPDISVRSANGVDAPVEFGLVAPDGGSLNCIPPSGSAFPVGVTPVTCVIRDVCRNTNTCTFQVTVSPSTGGCDEPALRILPAPVSAGGSPALTLTWDCGVLQSAPDLEGPWATVPSATSPWTISADADRRFYRVCLAAVCPE